jgi:hypothetical protein
MELLQIEEPGERGDAVEDAGLAVALELTDAALRLAASVGGNAEPMRDAAGGIDLLPAVAGYDDSGILVAGQPGLADLSAIGLDSMTMPDKQDARGATVADRVALLVQAAGRRLVQLTGRAIAGAVVIVPLDSTAGLRLALMQAIEAGGIPVWRLVESSVALALGGGLDRHEAGEYVHLSDVPAGIGVARLEHAGGTVRLVGGAVARHVDEVSALIQAEGAVRGLIAPGIEAAGAIAATLGVPLLDGFDGKERALLGAALLAEALG